ncbi:hypothetical protein Tdes44962_MAKER09987 [Teratosphaeria destructans]|uniref:Uncharacterized protein n=1 Tax=Teratosphaeria destructans TaxID=418781 RepID=A0A9W7SQG8_9PEZI|nr:hypothetical protein Tdes44962_MAKER09987 [Teratosphaeria destructans]
MGGKRKRSGWTCPVTPSARRHLTTTRPADSTYEPSSSPTHVSKRLRSSSPTSEVSEASDRTLGSAGDRHASPASSRRASTPLHSDSSSATDIDYLRNKRDWTVNILEERGHECRVKWAYTDVPDHLLQRDRDGRPYLMSDGIRHYPPKHQHIVDASGRRICRMQWEDEWIDKSLLNPTQSRESSPVSQSSSSISGDSSYRVDATSQTIASSPPGNVIRSREVDEGYIGSSEMNHAARGRRREDSSRSSSLEIVWPRQTPAPYLRFKPNKLDVEYRLRAAIKSAHKNGRIYSKRRKPSKVCAQWLDPIKYPRRRPVEFKRRFVKRGQHFNIREARRATAALVHEIGYRVLNECTNCKAGKGTFKGCIVHEDFHDGCVCTNCACSDRSTSCSFHRQSEFARSRELVCETADSQAATDEEGPQHPRVCKALNPPLERSAEDERTPSPVPTEAPDTKYKLGSRCKNPPVEQAASAPSVPKRTPVAAKETEAAQVAGSSRSQVNNATTTPAAGAAGTRVASRPTDSNAAAAATTTTHQAGRERPGLPEQGAERATRNADTSHTSARPAVNQISPATASSSGSEPGPDEPSDHSWRLFSFDHIFLRGPKTRVLAGTRFGYKRMTEAQFNFIYECCSPENRWALFRHARWGWRHTNGSGWPKVQWMVEHFRTGGRGPFNEAVVDVVCPTRVARRPRVDEQGVVDLTVDE